MEHCSQCAHPMFMHCSLIPWNIWMLDASLRLPYNLPVTYTWLESVSLHQQSLLIRIKNQSRLNDSSCLGVCLHSFSSSIPRSSLTCVQTHQNTLLFYSGFRRRSSLDLSRVYRMSILHFQSITGPVFLHSQPVFAALRFYDALRRCNNLPLYSSISVNTFT